MMFSACEKGPAEKAGEQIDQAVEKTSDTVKDAKRKAEEDLRN
jgi:vacuolar-type H+-ATPase subunit H